MFFASNLQIDYIYIHIHIYIYIYIALYSKICYNKINQESAITERIHI